MTWSCKEINKLDELLIDQLETKKIIKDVKTTKISQPGENYGSIMYRLDITLENKENKKEEIVYTVAKVLPEGERIREVFNIQTTYKNEMAFYRTVVPALVDFQKELGIQKPIDCFAKCYAVRKNLLDNSDIIDDDAILLLENLKISGFDNIDKVKGFDIETAKMVIKDIAQLHGVALALKIKKPKIFEENIIPYCNDYYRSRGEMPVLVPVLKLVINENEETRKLLSTLSKWDEAKRILPREPFATLVHDDLWTNNTMQKFDNGQPVANKLVDFQIISYGSPATDLFFFLWSSIPLTILKSHLDYFIKYYHDNLIEVLKRHGVDVAPFSFEKFLEEIHAISPFEFKHAFYFHLVAVHGRKGGYSENDMQSPDLIYETISDVAKEKAWYMVKECYNRGWFR